MLLAGICVLGTPLPCTVLTPLSAETPVLSLADLHLPCVLAGPWTVLLQSGVLTGERS